MGGGRIILFSSASIYGTPTIDEEHIDEQKTYNTFSLNDRVSPYSESKRMVEVIANAYFKQYQIDMVIARMSYVYGYAEQMPDTAFFGFVEAVINNKDVRIMKSGLPRRDNIHVSDVVSALMFIALYGKKGDVYNVSSNGEKGNYKSVDEIASKMIEIAGNQYGTKSSFYSSDESCASRDPGFMMDNKRLKELGWELQMSIDDGLKDVLDKSFCSKR